MFLDITEAIHSLIPNTEWHYTEGVLTVFTKGVTAPTQEELLAEQKRLELENEKIKEAKLLQRQNLLERLGISEEEVKLLIG